MARILVQIVINAIALYVAGYLVGAQLPGDLWQWAVLAAVFGVLNSVVRPILSIITCPAYILTLGLFTFVMNMIILWLTERLTGLVEWGGAWNLFLAGIIISVVSFLLNLFLGQGDSNARRSSYR